MLLAITKSVRLPVPVEDVWTLVRDPGRVAACLSQLEDFVAAGEPGRYTTTLVERLGPFSIRVPLTIAIDEDPTARSIVARVAGDDRGGAARVRGDVRATAREAPGGEGSELEVVSNVEVLGRLATLGAAPMRRRGDQVFDQFVANVATLLGTAGG
jgi:carbon monoxide dehydrogenase subunit G